MKLQLSCADFSFPLLPHQAALKAIALLETSGVDIGLFANRGHLRPEKELRNPEKNGKHLRHSLDGEGLTAADIFLQLHDNFTDYAVNHPDAKRRQFARQQFVRALDYAAAAGSKHVTILPGVTFQGESRQESLRRAAGELLWREEQAGAAGLTVGIEPHIGSITDTPERALHLASHVPRLGLTLDYAHFTRVGIPDSRIQPLASRATHFHARCACKNRLQSSLKQNTINFRRALQALNAHHFHGWIALEYVWIDWEHCNEVDVISESVQLKQLLESAAAKIK
jgi:sugar phosphate isomerase/epimerase